MAVPKAGCALLRLGVAGSNSLPSFSWVRRGSRAGLAHSARVERGPPPRKLVTVLLAEVKGCVVEEVGTSSPVPGTQEAVLNQRASFQSGRGRA